MTLGVRVFVLILPGMLKLLLGGLVKFLSALPIMLWIAKVMMGFCF